MKKLLPMLLCLLVPAVSFGQGIVNDIALKNLITGIAPAAGATVTVCTSAGTGIPCTPQATVYSDIALTVTKTNPLTADSNGYYSFYAASGTYIVTVTGAGTSGRSITYTVPLTASGNTGPINMSNKLVDVIGGAADSLSNVNTVANFKLYSVSPLTQPQATQFHQIDVSGSHTGGNGAFGADMVQFNQARVHDVTGTWPAFWEMQGMESEAEAFGSCSAPCGTTIPNFRLVSIGAQSHVRDSGADNIVVPFVFDIWGLGPFRDSSSIASRPGTITVTNGSTAVTGSGTNFSSGADAGKLLWVAPNTQNGSMASSGCVITAVISATSMTCTSAWTWLTQTSNFWTTTATSATGPGGSTSSMTNTLGGYFSQSASGTSTNFAAAFDGAPGHTEQSIGALWKTNGVNQWSWQTTNNANTQSGDFSLIDFVPSANVFSLRFRNPGNDGASQRGDAYFNASGTNGRVNINFLPGTGFAGEGAPTNVGTGGLCVGTGGAGATLTANPCALTGVIAIPFGTSIKSCNNGAVTPCAGDIPLVGTTGVNSEAVGDATAVNELFLSAATDDVVGSPKIIPLTAGATDLGSTARPFGNLWLGTAATNNTRIIGSATTAARNLTLPDADSLTPSFLNCGTTSTCAKTNQTRLIVLNGGPIALSTGTLTVTALPFTSSTSYVCSADDSTGINGIDVVYNSGTSVTFNGTGSDSIRYTCVGN